MTINSILILDTETTGLDHAKDVVIEVACAEFHVPSACVVKTFSTLLSSDGGSPVANPAERVNHIPAEAIRMGIPASFGWDRVDGMAFDCDLVLAHNAPFDRGFVPAGDERPLNRLHWVDTKEDIAWPLANKPGESLVNLTLAHGLGIGHAHRAMADVDMLCRLLTRCHEMGHDLQKMLANALRPKGFV